MEERKNELLTRPEEGRGPVTKPNDLWTGGSWEHPEEPVPAMAPVVIPERPMETRRRKKKRRKRKIPWFGVLVAVIFVAALGVAALRGVLYEDGKAPLPFPEPPYENISTEPPSIDRFPTGGGLTLELEREKGEPLTYAQIYDKALPSVVYIEAYSDEGGGAGTGVILSEDGYVLTNAHVVAGGEEVMVVMSDNSYAPAELVGFANDEDLAVLKIDRKDLTPAEFGDSGLLRPGDPVAALGNPMSYRFTITGGILSGMNRSVDSGRGEMLMLQTDAPLNHGNSGGALLNQYGQVVGINTIKIVTGDGASEALGFAIPSRRVKYVADRLIAGEPVELSVFGFTIMTVPEPQGGLTVLSVLEESDCYKKGLREGDVILAVNGEKLISSEQLAALKLDLAPGEKLSLTYRRDGKETTVEVALIARPASFADGSDEP